MGLGETQVFQDEKSRLANTTVARIVADGHRGGAAAPGDVPGDLSAWSWTRKSLPRTVNGTGHTDPSEFCATSI